MKSLLVILVTTFLFYAALLSIVQFTHLGDLLVNIVSQQ